MKFITGQGALSAEIPEYKTITAPNYPSPGKAWYCTAILALGSMITALDRGIINLLIEPIKLDLHLSDVEVSLIIGFAFTFFYAIFGLPVARMIDHGIRSRILAIGIGIFSTMTMFCGMAANFWHLFLARMGLGVGETTVGPASFSLLSDYFPPHRLSRAITVMQLGFVGGSAGALLLGGWLIATIGAQPHTLPILGVVKGWQAVLMTIALPGFLTALLVLTVREPARRGAKRHEGPVDEVFRFVFRHRLIYLPLLIGMGLRSAQMYGIQSWAAPFYQRTFGWEPSQYAVVGGISILISMPLGLFLGNFFTEKLSAKGYPDAHIRVVLIATCVSVSLGMIFPMMPNPWLAAALACAASLTAMVVSTPEIAAIQTVTPNALRGQMTFVFMFTINVIGSGAGPLIVGSFSQYVFGESNIRFSLVAVAMAMGAPAIFSFWRCLAPYRQAIVRGEPLE